MEGRPIPVSVQVFGILNLIFGSFGLVTSPLFYLTQERTLQIYRQYGAGSITLALVQFSLTIAPIIAIVLLTTGIGLLKKQEWGRQGAIGLACFSIATNLVVMIMVVTTFVRALSINSSAAIGGIIGGVFGGVFGLIYPCLTLIFLTRPVVKAALERRS